MTLLGAGILNVNTVGGRPVAIPAIEEVPPTPTTWSPAETADWLAATAEMTNDDYVFLTGLDADGITGGQPIPDGTAVGNGDPVGFWPNGLAVEQGLTARSGLLPTWNSPSDAVVFAQPAGLGRALIFPQDILAAKWHLMICVRSADGAKGVTQCVVQLPQIRLLLNQGGVYNLQTQIIASGVETNHIIRAGFSNGWMLIELRRDGSRLQFRTDGQAWTEVSVATWANWSQRGDATSDLTRSLIGRSSFTDGDIFADYLSWTGDVNGAILRLDWLDGDAAAAARRLVVRGQPVGDLEPAEPPAPPPAGDEPGVAGATTNPVSTYNQLATACAAAGPGTRIGLSNGTYSGNRITISASGTAANPIVVRANNLLGAIVPNAFLVTGNFVIIRGIQFSGTQNNEYRCEIGGNDNQMWRCKFFFYGGYQLRLLTGRRARIMYCEWESTAPNDDYQPSTRCIHSQRDLSNEDMRDAEVGFCYFHNLPSKPIGEKYSFRRRGGIVNGTAGRDQTRESAWWVHHCLFRQAGSHRLGIYQSGYLVEYCTIVGRASRSGSAESPSSADFDFRMGRNSTFRGLVARDTRPYQSFEIRGGPHRIISCHVVQTPGIGYTPGPFRHYKGNIESTTVNQDAYPRSTDVKMSGCFGKIVIASSASLPLVCLRPRMEQHTGGISYISGSYSGQIETNQLTETLIPYREMTPAEVGVAGNGVI